jgi:hypothetical protein
MDEPSFGGLLLVVGVAFAAPFLLGLFPRLRLPSIVLEIVVGIVIGPAVLGWVELDAAIEVLALLGLAFLLFLAGLEIEFEHLKGRARQGHGSAKVRQLDPLHQVLVAPIARPIVAGRGLQESHAAKTRLLVTAKSHHVVDIHADDQAVMAAVV